MAKPMVKKGVQRILLCGFMGCGKTSVGQALSFRLKWEFLDTDAMIEKREGRKIPEIFAQDGEAAFRQMEAQTAASLGRRRNTVISTGGGFLMQPETVKALRETAADLKRLYFWTAPLRLVTAEFRQATVHWCETTPKRGWKRFSTRDGRSIFR